MDMAVLPRPSKVFSADFSRLRNGPPSHDTLTRGFNQLDPDQFRACFQKNMARFGGPTTTLSRSMEGRCVALTTRIVHVRLCT